jgi:hypothetical protein
LHFKVSGQRVELGVVESALRQLDVDDCVVVYVAGERPFVGALVVGNDGHPKTSGELRNSLETRLPRHMVPSKVLVVSTLPRLASGKIDRRESSVLLTSSAKDYSSTLQSSSMPDITSPLYRLWQENLNIDHFDKDSTYFEVGGDSISAIKLVSAVRS